MSSDTSVASADIPDLEQGRARWRKAVAGVLAKSRTGELPAEPERLLDTATYEGFDIHPLYTALDAVPQAPLPGSFPFTRGGDGDRDVLTGWRVMESFPAAGVAAGAGNAAVLGALSDGVSGLVLRIGAHGIPAADVDRHLEGVFLELVPVVLDAGTDLLVAADAVLDLVAALPADKRGALSIDCGADPLTAAGDDAPEPADVIALATRLAEHGGGIRAITVDGPALHNRGANAALELAGAIAAGVAYVRLLTEAGLRAETERLLADPRARTALRDFFAQFLDLGRLGGVTRDPVRYPLWSPTMIDSMRTEVTLLVEDLVYRQQGDIRSMFSTRNTFVNSDLAALYGVPAEGATPITFVPALLPADGPRAGLTDPAAADEDQADDRDQGQQGGAVDDLRAADVAADVREALGQGRLDLHPRLALLGLLEDVVLELAGLRRRTGGDRPSRAIRRHQVVRELVHERLGRRDLIAALAGLAAAFAAVRSRRFGRL